MGARGPLSPETRQKISEAAKRRYLKSIQERKTEPTEKRCPKCQEMKPLAEFGMRKAKRASGVIAITPCSLCKRCEARRVAEWKQRKEEEGTWPIFRERRRIASAKADRREYLREWKAAQRRENGVKPRNVRPKEFGDDWGLRLPVEPLACFLEELDEPSWRIASLSGISQRRIYAILHGEQSKVSLAAVDAILTALGFQDRLHDLYPEEEEGRQHTGYSVLDPDGVLERFAETGEVV